MNVAHVDNQPPRPPPTTGAPFLPPGASFTGAQNPAHSMPSFGGTSGLKSTMRPLSGTRPLALPRRASPLQRAQDASAATIEARRSIDRIFSQSRTPWGGETSLSLSQVEELQKAVRTLEAKSAERDLAISEAQMKLAERERELAEAEALLAARERVLAAARKDQSGPTPVSTEQAEALRKLKDELERQEASMREQRQALKEREDFLDQSETLLFCKMQAQQEKETELEQKEEDLRRKMKQMGLLADEPPPTIEKA